MATIPNSPNSPNSSLTAVANKAGVSIATASRVINQKPPYTRETQSKVMAAAKSLNYVPDRRFRAMGQRNAPQLGHVGLLLNSTSKADFVSSQYYGRMFWSIEQACSTAGRHVLVATLTDDSETFLPRFVHDMQVDGVVIVDYFDKNLLTRIAASLPTVLVKARGDSPLVKVSPDESATITRGLDHLYELGHRRIVFFDINDNTPPNLAHAQRSEEFEVQSRSSRYANLEPRQMILPSRKDSLQRTAESQLLNWMAEPDRPTAIFCCCDRYAHAFLKAASIHGISIPREISIMGVDDENFAEHCQPSLTSIRQPFDAIGQHAVRILLEMIEQQGTGQAPAHPSMLLDVELIMRDSTGPMAHMAKV